MEVSTNGHDCVLLAHREKRSIWPELLGVLLALGLTLGGSSLIFLWLLDLL